ncbi:MAG TPA: 50S ribosomal protein L17 [Chthoniobacterales bacterium]|nr:50S ribosomal protein L17 [Chthoniobacterales bacterium]
MRHQKKTLKLGRTAEHRKALLANLVCSLIEHQRIKTTLAKAKAVRPLAEKMVTLGKKGSLHARRTAMAVLRQKGAVKKLFEDIAPRSATRNGGYTRIVKLGARKSDAAPVAFIEWIDAPLVVEEVEPEEKGKKRKGAKAEAKSEAKPDRKSKKSDETETETESEEK